MDIGHVLQVFVSTNVRHKNLLEIRHKDTYLFQLWVWKFVCVLEYQLRPSVHKLINRFEPWHGYDSVVRTVDNWSLIWLLILKWKIHIILIWFYFIFVGVFLMYMCPQNIQMLHLKYKFPFKLVSNRYKELILSPLEH